MHWDVFSKLLLNADSIGKVKVEKEFKIVAGGEIINVPVGIFRVAVCVNRKEEVTHYYIHVECQKEEDRFLSFGDFISLLSQDVIRIAW